MKSPTPQHLRIVVRNKGCAGLSYHLEYVDKPGKFDEVVEQDGVKVLIDSKALFSIIGSEMDWKEDGLRCVSFVRFRESFSKFVVVRSLRSRTQTSRTLVDVESPSPLVHECATAHVLFPPLLFYHHLIHDLIPGSYPHLYLYYDSPPLEQFSRCYTNELAVGPRCNTLNQVYPIS